VKEESHWGEYTATATRNIWIDLAHDVAHSEFRGDPGPEHEAYSETLITADGINYRHDTELSVLRGRAQTCPGTDKTAISALSVCPQKSHPRFQISEVRIEAKEYDNKRTVAVIWHTVSEGSDETLDYDATTYFDPETSFPIAQVSEGTIKAGESYSLRSIRKFEHDFIGLDSLPPKFFDPASIDYVQKDPTEPLERLRSELVIFWLGRTFSPGNNLPDLALHQVSVPSGGPGYKAELHYGPVEDEFKPSVVALELWKLSDWQAFLEQSARHGNSWDSLCVHKEEMELSNGRAIIFKGHHSNFVSFPPGPREGESCPSEPFNQFLAHVYLGETMVFVKPIGTYDTSFQASPYDSLAGIQTIISGLTPR
jgi:hypothetical protein